MLAGIAFEVALAIALIYVPGLNGAFHQSPLGALHWAYLLGILFVMVAAEEARKGFLRHREARPGAESPAVGSA